MFDGSLLSIRKKEGGGYAVGLETHGCVGGWSFERTARYKDGILRLNKAVEEYDPGPYDTLYAISVDGKEYVISQRMIRFLVKNYSKNGVVDWSKHFRLDAFRRDEEIKDKASK
jgi:hypothetical protein